MKKIDLISIMLNERDDNKKRAIAGFIECLENMKDWSTLYIMYTKVKNRKEIRITSLKLSQCDHYAIQSFRKLDESLRESIIIGFDVEAIKNIYDGMYSNEYIELANKYIDKFRNITLRRYNCRINSCV